MAYAIYYNAANVRSNLAENEHTSAVLFFSN